MELTDTEKELRQGRLEQKAHIGAVMRDFCKHPGFAILQSMIEEKITDSRNAWLKAETPAQAEELRLQVKPWNEVLDMIKKRILEGDAAALALRPTADSEQE